MSIYTESILSKEETRPMDCNIGIYMRRPPKGIPADQDPTSYCQWCFRNKYRNRNGTRNETFYIDICGRTEITMCPQMLRLLRDCRNGKIDLVFAESITYVAPRMIDVIFWLYYLLHLNHKVEIIVDLALNTERSSDHRQRTIEATESIVQKDYEKYAKWEAELLNAMNKLGE